MTTAPLRPGARRTAVAALLFVPISGVLLAIAIDTGLPFSALRPMQSPSSVARNLAPQGWGFFTRDPHEPAMVVWRRDASGWIDAGFGPNAQPQQLFGWRRAARAQGVESGALLFAHGRMDFTACEADLPRCLEGAESRGDVVNPVPSPTLCGDVALVRQYTVPWAWARSMPSSRAPASVLRLEVSC